MKNPVIRLRAIFRMGGVVYKGYEVRGDTLVFRFERSGDFFIQVIETKEVKTREKLSPAKVLMEVTTNGKRRIYEARLVEERGGELIYEVSEF
ncbi:hypothetical protein [Pyrococcus yayanosii]|uniref:Uncharacterized protein n=1 Tax=Pyrococcus yayanosii (strain CH1 / JCM 16557) TaxID=529709 RepID=F8AJB4_PYRYC|nr:hypothetical protein [Pyrococcus yayanosii]AEH24561.1 hypothetical protein PYCH_08760 [Pyrococcus yayanosii CH1]